MLLLFWGVTGEVLPDATNVTLETCSSGCNDRGGGSPLPPWSQQRHPYTPPVEDEGKGDGRRKKARRAAWSSILLPPSVETWGDAHACEHLAPHVFFFAATRNMG
jgi:hypothetical protein